MMHKKPLETDLLGLEVVGVEAGDVDPEVHLAVDAQGRAWLDLDAGLEHRARVVEARVLVEQLLAVAVRAHALQLACSHGTWHRQEAGKGVKEEPAPLFLSTGSAIPAPCCVRTHCTTLL
jgi:hypothetical protein